MFQQFGVLPGLNKKRKDKSQLILSSLSLGKFYFGDMTGSHQPGGAVLCRARKYMDYLLCSWTVDVEPCREKARRSDELYIYQESDFCLSSDNFTWWDAMLYHQWTPKRHDVFATLDLNPIFAVTVRDSSGDVHIARSGAVHGQQMAVYTPLGKWEVDERYWNQQK